ncbi:hypothetical protein BKA70DRAFT_1108581 [Coprinopsis sp. MPI-PUGE-AT-0042]|nr:hypothetical protein BKA70DRAFT_1113762 [Coprinopsis sp. MPI-PUGE-AT-0042]KAH6905051.1 hypothetical protein BKA70DRAFT_1108581 [Coprinopsis sp. MPI-PUGE-AT-0042]
MLNLPRRYRQMPAFGSDAVRKFSSNASEQKRLGARDYENLLQCAIPAFDGLLSEPHNSIVCHLLAICAEWHALAKLRMHTENTLQLLESTTVLLARQFNIFTETTCSAYQTTETSKEYTARLRRASKAVKHGGNSNPPPLDPQAAAHPSGRLSKTFNLNTYKYHAVADYASTIRSFGTTDSYSSERVRGLTLRS